MKKPASLMAPSTPTWTVVAAAAGSASRPSASPPAANQEGRARPGGAIGGKAAILPGLGHRMIPVRPGRRHEGWADGFALESTTEPSRCQPSVNPCQLSLGTQSRPEGTADPFAASSIADDDLSAARLVHPAGDRRRSRAPAG